MSQMTTRRRGLRVAIIAAITAFPVVIFSPAQALPAIDQQGAVTAKTWSGSTPRPTKTMSPTNVDTLNSAINSALESTGELTPGAWVGIWDPQKGVHVGGYGFRALPNRKATVGTHNFIGSVTKTVTATAVLQQIAAGTFSLSDTVKELDPKLAKRFPAIAAITVNQLLSMSSGIPDYANEPAGVLPLIAENSNRSFTRNQLIAIGLAANEILPPGSPGYSTTNYIILGQLLKATTGKSPESLINLVFEQAGMNQSRLTAPGVPRPALASRGYVGPQGSAEFQLFGVSSIAPLTDVSSWNLSWGREGGGAYSTIKDLGRWGELSLGTALLPEKMGNERVTQLLLKPEGTYGWGLFNLGGGWIGHTGQVVGWESSIKQNPKTGAVVAIMVNSTSGLGDIESAVNEFLGL